MLFFPGHFFLAAGGKLMTVAVAYDCDRPLAHELHHPVAPGATVPHLLYDRIGKPNNQHGREAH